MVRFTRWFRVWSDLKSTRHLEMENWFKTIKRGPSVPAGSKTNIVASNRKNDRNPNQIVLKIGY